LSELFGFDAYSPKQIAQRIDQVAVAKVQLPFLSMLMLGILAGVFIGLGALAFVLVKSDPSLGFASSQLLGGLAFSLGLILVVVAGAELFTVNNLIVMAWADGKISSAMLLQNWFVVCIANLIGGVGLAILVFLSGHTDMNGGQIAQQYVDIAISKTSLSFSSAFFKGVLCNILVCMAVWMTLAGRSVVDKVMAIIFPITVFVAAGFEHSIANMYLIPMGILIQQSADLQVGAAVISWSGLFYNLMPVILGNLLGGSVLVGLVYHVIYRRPA
jgi:formate/nitrite transporter